ncbi:MAG: sensor histidine kinase [Desulfitobacteriaceae bacterium]
MGKKLFLSTLAIVLITLALSMLSINYVFKQQFSDYLTRTTEATLEQLPERLASAYKDGHWDEEILTSIGQSLPLGTEVTLNDPAGHLIATLMNAMDTMHKNLGNMGMNNVAMSNMMGMPYSVQGWKTKTIPIGDAQKTLATAIIRYPTNARILNPEDTLFISSVFRWLFIASGLALILGILLSYLTARHLVSPLKRLTQAAYRIGQGHLEDRVRVATKDEIGQLAAAFNVMADNLRRQEELRKQFTADIAHELRTPLTSMRSYVEAFQDGVLLANSENLSALNEEIDRLVDLSSDLRDLNIAEIGALKANLLPVNLNDLIGKVVSNLYPLIQEKELDLRWNPTPESVGIDGDVRLLTRLFYNLIHNAYKYTEGGGHIAITVEPVADHVDVLVKDSGIGIPEDDLPLIFERFYRTDKSRTRETGGSGIGLALVRQIVILHKGNISVQSKVGHGTTFKLTLPKES